MCHSDEGEGLSWSFPFAGQDDFEQTYEKRPSCKRCRRPAVTCICEYFPESAIDIKTKVHILQHPKENSTRLLTTVPLLQECLPRDRCTIYVGKKFSERRFPELRSICASNRCVLLYPTPDAIELSDLSCEQTGDGSPLHLIVIDGTWREAKSMYFHNTFLHTMKKVKLSGKWKSEFVIRTQPFNECLCTMEAVAIALGQLENKPTLIDIVRKPLKALCDVQLNHGAVPHDSKEEKEKYMRACINALELNS